MNHKLLDLKRLTVLRVHGTSIQGAAGARRAAPGTRGRSGADSRSVARSVGEQRRAPCRPEPPCGFRGGGVFFFLSPPPFPLSPPPPSPVDLTLTGGFFSSSSRGGRRGSDRRSTMSGSREEERRKLADIINHWNANRLDLFEISRPTEVRSPHPRAEQQERPRLRTGPLPGGGGFG